MKTILVATEKPFAKQAVDGIKEIVEKSGNKFKLLENYTDKQQLLDAVADADAIIIRSDKVTDEVMAAGKNLKIVVRAGAGYDNVDLEAATKRGIVVMNTPGQNSNAVAELVFGLLVFGVRNFYNGKSGTELKGKKLGILAFGQVGRNVARVAKGFDMDVYAYDAFCPKEVIEAAGVKAVDNQDALFGIVVVLFSLMLFSGCEMRPRVAVCPLGRACPLTAAARAVVPMLSELLRSFLPDDTPDAVVRRRP